MSSDAWWSSHLPQSSIEPEVEAFSGIMMPSTKVIWSGPIKAQIWFDYIWMQKTLKSQLWNLFEFNLHGELKNFETKRLQKVISAQMWLLHGIFNPILIVLINDIKNIKSFLQLCSNALPSFTMFFQSWLEERITRLIKISVRSKLRSNTTDL